MSITAQQIARVRALAGVTAGEFADAAVESAIEEYPRRDSAGLHPEDDGWTETYDLYRAAADLVDQKAASTAAEYDTSADGASLTRSQIQAQLHALATRLRARGAVKLNRVIILPDTELDEEDEDE